MQVFEDIQNQKYEKKLSANADLELLSHKGEAIISDTIEFNNVPIVSPNGDVLVRDLTFHVKPGMHLLIVGPNGW